MKKVKILVNTVAGGEPVEKGDVIEVSEKDYAVLIQMGKAEDTDKGKTESSKKSEAKK